MKHSVLLCEREVGCFLSLDFPAACCRQSVSGCGGSVCGCQEMCPGLIWRTMKVVSMLKPLTFTLLCPVPCACSQSDTYLRGENIQYVSKMSPCVSDAIVWFQNTGILLHKLCGAIQNVHATLENCCAMSNNLLEILTDIY